MLFAVLIAVLLSGCFADKAEDHDYEGNTVAAAAFLQYSKLSDQSFKCFHELMIKSKSSASTPAAETTPPKKIGNLTEHLEVQLLNQCAQLYPKFRPMIAFRNFHRNQSYFGEICKSPKEPLSAAMRQDAEFLEFGQQPANAAEIPICQYLEAAAHLSCAMNCGGDEEFADKFYALEYIRQQLFRQHPKPFKCDNAPDLNPQIYSADFKSADYVDGEVECSDPNLTAPKRRMVTF